jgi:hypothetical protein
LNKNCDEAKVAIMHKKISPFQNHCLFTF